MSFSKQKLPALLIELTYWEKSSDLLQEHIHLLGASFPGGVISFLPLRRLSLPGEERRIQSMIRLLAHAKMAWFLVVSPELGVAAEGSGWSEEFLTQTPQMVDEAGCKMAWWFPPKAFFLPSSFSLKAK